MANKNKSKHSSHDSAKAHDPVVHKAAAGHEEDLIIVPKERSRFYYLLMLGLMMFTLLIFTVGGLFESVIGGGGGGNPAAEVVMKWQEPGGEAHEVTAAELRGAMQSVDLLSDLRIYPTLDPDGNVEHEDGALALILDHMSVKSGVQISDEEFRKRLRSIGWTGDTMRQIAANYRTTTKKVEDDVRWGLRISKFRNLVSSMAIVAPDPDAVAARWQESNPEFQFQVVELKGDAYLEQAKTEVPTEDEVLQKWFRSQPANIQRALFTEELLQPQVAWVNLESEYDLTNLLELYPAGEDWDEALQAQTYYNRYSNTRFKKPLPEDETGGEDSEAGEDGETDSEETDVKPQEPLYFTFEEVEEQVIREANIARALGQFTQDIIARSEKANKEGSKVVPEFDQEAISLGLEVFSSPEMITRTETQENPDWGGIQTVNQLGFLRAGQLTRQAVVNEKSMLVAKIVEKQRPKEPEFAEIREQVTTMWAENRSEEIAQETLRKIYDGFQVAPEEGADPDAVAIDLPVAVDDAAFLQAASEAGLEIVERPYYARGKSASDDPEEQTDLDRHLRSQPVLYTMDKGALAAPAQSFTKEATYLVRLADKRDPDLSGLKAQQLFQTRSQVVNETQTAFNEATFQPASETFKQKFGLWMKSWEETEAEAEEEDTAETGA